MGLTLRDQEHHTYADYRAWPEDARYELIDGRAYAMVPAPSVAHQEVVGEIYRQIADAIEGTRCRAFIAPLDVRLPEGGESDEATDTVLQPDLLVVCNTDRIDDRGVRGAPDWVIEVLSPSSAAHDQVVKRSVYERHGVKEYWLVHPTDRLVMIYRLEKDGYGKPEVAELQGETRCGLLPELAIVWEQVTRRLK